MAAPASSMDSCGHWVHPRVYSPQRSHRDLFQKSNWMPSLTPPMTSHQKKTQTPYQTTGPCIWHLHQIPPLPLPRCHHHCEPDTLVFRLLLSHTKLIPAWGFVLKYYLRMDSGFVPCLLATAAVTLAISIYAPLTLCLKWVPPLVHLVTACRFFCLVFWFLPF